MPTVVEFVEADLLVDISQAELDGIGKEETEPTEEELIPRTITEQRQKFYDYTRRYEVPDDRAKRIIRALVLFELYSRLNAAYVPDFRKTKYEEAMRELREIRDGKFPDLLAEDDPVGGALPTQGASGYETRVSMNWMGRSTD